MLNLVAEGKIFQYAVPPSTLIKGGDLVLIADVVGVAAQDGNGDNGDIISVQVGRGVFTTPKAAEAIPQGSRLYFDPTAKVITKVPTNNVQCGWAYTGALIGDATVETSLMFN